VFYCIVSCIYSAACSAVICVFYCVQYYCTATGWRRLIGSPKLQIIFHKRATKYRSLLRKMTYQDEGSYESSPPCTHDILCVHSCTLCSAIIYIFNCMQYSTAISHVFYCILMTFYFILLSRMYSTACRTYIR